MCGGLTPAYQEAFVADAAATSSLLAERDIPYAGFSAGAALAARDAVVGGWRADGVAVCPEDAGEDLDEVAVRPGLGLVPFAVDVHAAQWGTLPRLAAAVAAGRVERGSRSTRTRRSRWPPARGGTAAVSCASPGSAAPTPCSGRPTGPGYWSARTGPARRSP